MTTDTLKTIKMICTGPLANETQKELRRMYDNWEIDNYDLEVRYNKEKADRQRKWYTRDNIKPKSKVDN